MVGNNDGGGGNKPQGRRGSKKRGSSSARSSSSGGGGGRGGGGSRGSSSSSHDADSGGRSFPVVSDSRFSSMHSAPVSLEAPLAYVETNLVDAQEEGHIIRGKSGL